MKSMTGKSRFAAMLVAMLMVTLLALAPAQADWLSDMLAGYGLGNEDVQAFSSLVSEMGAGMSEAEVQSLLKEFLGDTQAERAPGTLEGNRYTSPEGFAFTVPAGWSVLEDQFGVATVLSGAADEAGFMPTISIVVLGAERPDFVTNTREDWDALLGESLANYLFVALDDFPYLDVPAHEFVCMHGEREDTMFMQYQLYFNKEGRAFIITMSTMAEESAHEDALDAYDAFLAEFEVLDNGVG